VGEGVGVGTFVPAGGPPELALAPGSG